MRVPLAHKACHDFKGDSNLMLDEFCHQQDFESMYFSNVRVEPVTGVLTDSGSEEPVPSCFVQIRIHKIFLFQM